MSQARERNMISRIRCELTQPTQFGPPATLTFGNPGSAGQAAEFSRADHIHPVVELPRLFEKFRTRIFGFYEFVAAGTPNDNVAGSFSGRSADLDILTVQGGLGSLGPDVASNGGGSEAMLANTATPHTISRTTFQQHTPRRIKNGRFQTRARIGNSNRVPPNPFSMTATPNDYRQALGILRTTVDNDLGTITDGIYFWLETVGTTQGTWKARCTKDSVTTEVALTNEIGGSIGIETVGSTPSLLTTFQDFKITMNSDATQVDFELLSGAGTIYTATITTNIPTALCAGWGGFLDRTDTAQINPKTLVLDYIEVSGDRF